MTTTDRRDADDATFDAEMDRLNRLEVADVAVDVAEAIPPSWRRELWARLSDFLGQHGPTIDTIDDDEHDELLTAFIDGLERDVLPQVCPTLPAPGTDTSGQAVQRVLDLCDELEQNRGALISHAGAARHIRAAVAGPQRAHGGEGS